MWRQLFLCLFLAGSLHYVESFSFFSKVFFRTLFPAPNPTPESVQVQQVKQKVDKRIEVRQGDDLVVETTNSARGELTVTLNQALLNSAYRNLPNELSLPSTSYRLPLRGSLRMTKAKAEGLPNYAGVEVTKVVHEEGEASMHVVMPLPRLSVYYDSVTVDYGTMSVRNAKGRLTFLSSSFTGEVRMMKNIPIRIRNKQCVLYVKSAKMSKLGGTSVEVTSAKNKPAPFTRAVLHAVMRQIEQRVSEQLTLVVNDYLRDHLPSDGANLCKDPEIDRVISSLKNADNKTP